MRVNRKFIRTSRGELAKEKNILLCKKKKKKNRRLIDEEEEEEEESSIFGIQCVAAMHFQTHVSSYPMKLFYIYVYI